MAGRRHRNPTVLPMRHGIVRNLNIHNYGVILEATRFTSTRLERALDPDVGLNHAEPDLVFQTLIAKAGDVLAQVAHLRVRGHR
jgi:hypothetical protein